MGPTKAVQQTLTARTLEPEEVTAKAVLPELLNNGTGLAVAESVTPTPMELLRMAIAQRQNIDDVTKFVEWYEKREAKKAYVAAMKQFKADPPVIIKNKHVHYSTTNGVVDYHHATLDNLCNEVIPALSKVGISHAWKVTQDKEFITVICVLTHELGHSEETQMMGLPDTSGNKSPLKALSSTVTTLQRYTLFAACGLAAGEDDETETGNGNGNPFIEASEIEKNCGEMARAKDTPELKFLFSVAYGKAEEIGDRKAMAHYVTAKDKRKAELQNAGR